MENKHVYINHECIALAKFTLQGVSFSGKGIGKKLFERSEESIDVNAECTLVNAMAYTCKWKSHLHVDKNTRRVSCFTNVAAWCGSNRLMYVTFCPRPGGLMVRHLSLVTCRFTVLSHSIVLSLNRFFFGPNTICVHLPSRLSNNKPTLSKCLWRTSEKLFNNCYVFHL